MKTRKNITSPIHRRGKKSFNLCSIMCLGILYHLVYSLFVSNGREMRVRVFIINNMEQCFVSGLYKNIH